MTINPQYADLHLHTTHSDGGDAPTRVVERAAKAKLSAIAIADHDTTSGIDEAQRAAQHHGIELLPAVEISAGYQGAEVHVLAYGIDTGHAPLQSALADLRTQREHRAEAMVEKLHAVGIPISRERLIEQSKGGAVGRMHVARALYLQGVTKTVQEAFDRFIGQGRPAFVPKATLPLPQALALIHDARGVAALAHPGLNSAIRKLLPQLLMLPFDGIEVYHVQHSPGEAAMFMELAQEHDLLITGGSDCHGNIKGHGAEMGKVRLAWNHYTRLKERLTQIHAT